MQIECTRLGIPFGVYIYSYAKTTAQAESEARHVLRLVKGYKLSYPVFYDLEESGTQTGAVDRMKKFAALIEAAGYKCGVYCNKSWWDNYLSSLGTRYPLWIARHNSTLGMKADMWQYSSDGSVPGISDGWMSIIAIVIFRQKSQGSASHHSLHQLRSRPRRRKT